MKMRRRSNVNTNVARSGFAPWFNVKIPPEPVRHFSAEERRKICEILGFIPDTAIAAAGLEVIENELHESRMSERLWAAKLKMMDKPPGRPSHGIEKLHDLWLLACAYEYTTGKKVRRTRTRAGSKRRDRNRFYELVQICLRLADPARLIAASLPPPGSPETPVGDRSFFGMDGETMRRRYPFFDDLPMGATFSGLSFVEAVYYAGFRPPKRRQP